MEELAEKISDLILKEKPFWLHLTLTIITLGIYAFLYVGFKLQSKIPKQKWKSIIFAKVYINEEEKQMKINNKIYNYNDILGYELLEDGNSVTKSNLRSAVGRAAIGSIINPVGAIIGGVTGKKTSSNICTKLEIKITINNIKNPCQYVKFIGGKVKKDSFQYKGAYEQAQKLMSILNIIDNNK